ncbi:alpha subunit of putative methylmalonyl-CoA decarboxylase [Ascodesmis nigricans]|uniref:Propionyl-CoA carboxylase beta chain, mitochondrial n=1 Tax=Ascodesmis nigricans TaxID=341454 RepID=A0A4S2N2S5_9PEZI|nr:alpha subunit of putative methylmalonyl-CoA decarboxylase [Ascodesmis nigricans]
MAPTDDASKATARLAQLQSHLPADYSDITSQLTHLETLARTPPTTQASYQRQLSRGKLWVRDRITSLLDPDSFYEIGPTTGSITWTSSSDGPPQPTDLIPSNNLQGRGTINSRRVLLTADDFAVRAGHADGALMEKTLYVERLALHTRTPIIKLVDGSSGGGSVTMTMKLGFTPLPSLHNFFSLVAQQCDLGIPNVGAILGPAVGLGATRAAMCHFTVIARDVGSFFAAGPKVVEHATFEEGLTNDELGGAALQTANGTLDNIALNEHDAFHQIRTFLSYVPSCGASELPPILLPSSDPITRRDLEIATHIPRRPARAANVPAIVDSLFDKDSVFVIGATFSRTSLTALARLGGHPVGVIANLSSLALDAAGCKKIAKHLRMCDVFNLPVVQLIDCPGFAVGSAAEREATMKAGVEMAKAYYSTTVPVYSIVVRRCYGVAGGIMVDPREMKERVFWPSAEFGSLPADGGGIEVAHRGELRKEAERRGREGYEKRLEELKREYRAMENPLRAAARFNVEEVIRPEETRRWAGEWVARQYEKGGVLERRVAERMAGRLVVRF